MSQIYDLDVRFSPCKMNKYQLNSAYFFIGGTDCRYGVINT
jgi:hypothetical protein